MAHVEDKLKAIIANQLEIEIGSISNSSRLVEDLGADSFGTMEIVMAIEEDFEMIIPEGVAKTFLTFGDVLTYLSPIFNFLNDSHVYNETLLTE